MPQLGKRNYRPALALILAVFAVIGVIVVSLLHPFRATSGSANKVTIVAAENFWGDIASQIGGSQVSVTSIISDPTTDPHLYESDAIDASAIASAQIVIVNGLGYDDFFNKLLGASKNDSRIKIDASDIYNVTANGANPHLWYDLPRAHIMAQNIEQALVQADPEHQALYAANLTKFLSSLQPALSQLSQIKMMYPGAPVAYTERVAQYALDAAGLSIKTPPGFASAIEDGSDPSPTDSAAMNTLVTGHSIKVLIYNNQATSPVTQAVRSLAAKNAIPVVGVSETIPARETNYQTWQLHQLQAIMKALQSQ
jgi:zinc/manganese transport system substrate-binding protein